MLSFSGTKEIRH